MNNPNTRAIQKALAQTISDNQFNADDTKKNIDHFLADSEDTSAQDETIDDILRATIDDSDAEYANSSFQIDTSDESNAGVPNINGTEQSINIRDANNFLNVNTGNGRYTLSAALGTGANGQVFSVHDNNFKRNIAVKFMHPKHAAHKEKLLQFIDEARITAKLDHPNILPIHDLDYTNRSLIYFTMGKVDGQTLQLLIDTFKDNQEICPLIKDINNRIRIMIQVCNAVAYAHTQGIIHNDIKPSNIMVGNYGEVLVVDWGTASEQNEVAEQPHRLQGTPLYMSPEQSRREGSSIQSDIYCIGATFFHLITMRYPCWNEDLNIFWEMKRTGKINNFSTEESKCIPPELRAILLKSIAPLSEDRYQSVTEMISDLESYQQGLSISAYKDSIKDIFLRIYRYNKKVIIVSIIGLILTVLTSIWLFFEKYSDEGVWSTVVIENPTHVSTNNIQPDWKFTPNRDNHGWLINGQSISRDSGLGSPAYIDCQHRFVANFRIGWDMTINQGQSAFIAYIGGNSADDAYSFTFSRIEKTITVQVLKQNGRYLSPDKTFTYDENAFHRFSLEKNESSVILSIDNLPIIYFQDPDMLFSSKHQRFGFVFTESSSVVIKNIQIEKQELGDKSSPLLIAHTYFTEKIYTAALQHYQQLYQSYPNSNISAVSLYRIGRCHSELGELNKARLHFQQFIQLYPNHTLFIPSIKELVLTLFRQNNYKHCLDTINLYRKNLYHSTDLLSMRLLIESERNDPLRNSTPDPLIDAILTALDAPEYP